MKLNYRFIKNTQSDHLAHKKGEERKDHKYIKREWKNGKWRYYYDTPKGKTGMLSNVMISQLTNKNALNSVGAKSGMLSNVVTSQITNKHVMDNAAVKVVNNQLNMLTKNAQNTPVNKLVSAIAIGKKSVENVLGITKEKNKIALGVLDNAVIAAGKKAIQNKIAEDERKKKERERLEKESQEQKEFENKEAERLKQEQRQATEKLNSVGDLATQKTTLKKSEDQAAVNPYYYTNDDKYTTNCAYCTAAYDLRRRGYDVEAAAISDDHNNKITKISSWYKDADVVTFNDLVKEYGTSGSKTSVKEAAEYLEKDLLKHGEGSMGHFCIQWRNGGGHDIVWEVENGEVIFRDCQTNSTTKDIETYISRGKTFEYFRSDNLEIDESILETVRNKKTKRYGKGKSR